jgi:hypothetical protein
MKPLLALLILATASGHAATVIDSTVLTPENQANFAAGTAGNLATGAAWTFTTGTLGAENVLAAIGLEGRNSGTGSNGSTLTLELWSNPANDNGSLDLANAVLIATSTNSSLLSLADAVTDFTFSGVTLASNTVYAVHVVGAGSPGFGLVGTTSTDLLAGSRLFNNGAFIFGGTAPNGIDASFRVVTAVPEPASALLGGLGLLALLRRRR